MIGATQNISIMSTNSSMYSIIHLNETCAVRKLQEWKRTNITLRDPMLQQMMNKLDVLLVSSQNDACFQDEYNKFKCEYDELLYERKKNFLQNVIKKSDNKIKATWSVVNSLRNQQRERDFLKGYLNDVSIGRINTLSCLLNEENSSTISVFSSIEEMNKSIWNL